MIFELDMLSGFCQMVKNHQIPESKFIVKGPLGPGVFAREAPIQKSGISQYHSFGLFFRFSASNSFTADFHPKD